MPPTRVVKNGVESCSNTSGSIPGPSSATVTATVGTGAPRSEGSRWSSAMRVSTSSVPSPSSAWSALRPRFRNTWVSRSGSARSSGIEGSKLRSSFTPDASGSIESSSSTSSSTRWMFSEASRSASRWWNTSRSSTSERIRSTSRTISAAASRDFSSLVREARISAAPRIPPSGFFTSCAMPEAIVP